MANLKDQKEYYFNFTAASPAKDYTHSYLISKFDSDNFNNQKLNYGKNKETFSQAMEFHSTNCNPSQYESPTSVKSELGKGNYF